MHYVHPGRQGLRPSDRPALRSVVETRSTPAMLADAAQAIADASRVIGEIDRTLARYRREHRSAQPDNGRPPPGTQIEHRIGRILSVT